MSSDLYQVLKDGTFSSAFHVSEHVSVNVNTELNVEHRDASVFGNRILDNCIQNSVPGRQAATLCSLMRGASMCPIEIPSVQHEPQLDCDVAATAHDLRCKLYCKHPNDVPMR